jgi:hypothetical protein
VRISPKADEFFHAVKHGRADVEIFAQAAPVKASQCPVRLVHAIGEELEGDIGGDVH